MLIVTGLLIAALCLPIGNVMEATGALHVFKPLGIAGVTSTWGLFCILLLAAFIELLTIFCYRVRVLQVRMVIFSSLLIVGYYLAAGAFYLALSGDGLSFTPSVGIVLPLIGIVLNYLAGRAILRDEAMVHAADRLR
jgi:hypothetical protein